jgi:hypothetical protein
LAEVIQTYSAVAERLRASHGVGRSGSALQQNLSRNAQLERSKRPRLGRNGGHRHEINARRDEDAQTASPTPLAVWCWMKVLWPVSRFSPRMLHCVADFLGPRSNRHRERYCSAFARQIEPKPQALDAESALQRVIDAHRPARDRRTASRWPLGD